MDVLWDSLTWMTFIVLAVAAIVIGGGVYAIRETVRRPSYDTAIAFGAGGLFATLFLLAVGQAAYVLWLWIANLGIASAPIELRPLLLAEAELEASSSLWVSYVGAVVTLLMASYLFVRALQLREGRRSRAPARNAPHDAWQPHHPRDTRPSEV